jgi:hypothetical protein
MADELKEQLLALVRVLGSEEVVNACADTNWAILQALISRGFTRDEAMQLVVVSAHGKGQS